MALTRGAVDVAAVGQLADRVDQVDVADHRQVVAAGVGAADATPRSDRSAAARPAGCSASCGRRAKSRDTVVSVFGVAPAPADSTLGKAGRAGRGRLEGGGGAGIGAVVDERLLVAGEQRLVVHQAGVGAHHRAAVGCPPSTPRRGAARSCSCRRTKSREVSNGAAALRRRHVVEVVAHAVEHLQRVAQPPVVLQEQPVEVRREVEVGLAEVLLERVVAERVGAAPGRQVGGGVGEGIELELACWCACRTRAGCRSRP